MADAAQATGLRDDRNVCQLCGALENLSLCGGCHDTWYCCKDHQRQHWKQHKRQCKVKQQSKVKKPAPVTSISKSNGSNATLDNAVSSSNKQEKVEPAASSTIQTSQPVSPPKTKEPAEHDEQKECSTKVEDCITKPASQETLVKSTVSDTEKKKPTESSAKDDTSTVKENDSSVFRVPLQTPKQSKTKKSKSKTVDKEVSGASQVVGATGRAEAGNGERFFLDRPFSQRIQSLQHTARARRSASTMAPQGVPMDNKDTYLEVLKSRFSVIADYVVNCLNKYGICVIDKFLGDVTGQEILSEAKQLRELGTMQQGQLVQSKTPSSPNIRGDIITWIGDRDQDGDQMDTDNIQFLVSCMDAVVQECSTRMADHSINERTKAMVACYPGRSTGYVRHVDNPNGDGRCITCIYYLNQDWDCRVHGGMLRIFPEGRETVANIEPTFDRLLFFWSDRRNPHEVMPAKKERYAITVWYYEAEERARALKRFKGELENPKKQAVPLFNGVQTREL